MAQKIDFREYHLFHLLNQFDAQPLPLDLFIHSYFRKNPALGSKDRRFLSDCAFGMIRWKGLLDYLNGEGSSWEKRYQSYLRSDHHHHQNNCSIPPHIRTSHPQELFALFIEQYGEKRALDLALINNSEAPITVRINSYKTTREQLLATWEGKFGASACILSPYGIRFPKRLPFSQMPEYREGLFEVQDEASQCVGLLIKAKPKDKILDFCAGAGGKTLAFAPFLQNKGIIFLHDIRKAAIDQARKRLSRAGINNVHYLPDLSSLLGKIDWVLVDTPCSGTGTYRRNPDMKERFCINQLNNLIEEQRGIFAQALETLAPRGRIIYATCSILRKENEGQVEYFLKKHPLVLEEAPFVSLPTYNGMDGFFAATFIRK